MGGAFIDHISWRWCFFINLPIGAVTFIFLLCFLYSPPKARSSLSPWEQIQQFDVISTIFFIPSIICLLLALQWGGSAYEWGDGRIIALFVVLGVLMITFVSVQLWRQANATLPPRIFANRNVWGSSSFTFCLGVSFFALVYYLPIWFQTIKGATAVKSGIMNLPMLLAQVILSIVAGACVTQFGYYTPFMVISSVLMAVGVGLLSTFQPNTGSGKWIGYQIIFGAGVGTGMQQALIAVQRALPPADVPIATATVMFSQTLGGAVFVSVAQNVFTNALLHSLSGIATVDPQQVVNIGATPLNGLIPADVLSHVVSAYNDGLVAAFYVSTAMGALSLFGILFVQWKSVKS